MTPTSLQVHYLQLLEQISQVSVDAASPQHVLQAIATFLLEKFAAESVSFRKYGEPGTTVEIARADVSNVASPATDTSITTVERLVYPFSPAGQRIGQVVIEFPRKDAQQRLTIALLDRASNVLASWIASVDVSAESDATHSNVQPATSSPEVGLLSSKLQSTLAIMHRLVDLSQSEDVRSDLEFCHRLAQQIETEFGYALSIGIVQGDRLLFPIISGEFSEPDSEWWNTGIAVGQGVTGRVARTGEPIYIPDVTKIDDYISSFDGARSEICVPVWVNSEIYGVLNVENGQNDPLGYEDFQILQAIALHVGQALDNRRLFDLEHATLGRMQILQEIASVVAENRNPEEALQQLVDTLGERMGYPLVAIFQRIDDQFVLNAVRGSDPSKIVFEKFRRDGQTTAILDGFGPVQLPRPDRAAVMTGELTDGTAILTVPVHYDDSIEGILVVSGSPDQPISQADKELLPSFADHIAIVLANTYAFNSLKELSRLDPVTGVPNHRYFQEQLSKFLEEARESKSELSLLIIDLDNFKQVNDSFGHMVGDEVLRTIAQSLSSQLRSQELVARYAGDEFVVLLPLAPSKMALRIATRITAAISSKFIEMPNGSEWRLTLSTGVATYPTDGTTPVELLRAADMAMYAAKAAGKNQARHFHEISGPIFGSPSISIVSPD